MMLNRIESMILILAMVFSGASLKAENYDFVVSQDGSGNFTSIQKAIDSCKAFPDARVTIYVKNGIYKEKLQVPSCNSRLSIIGESTEKTIITYDDYFDKISRGRNSTIYTYTLKATVLFEKCTIHCKSDSYITAASTNEGKPFGFVFKDCKITAATEVKEVYLGRPWRIFAKVAFLNCVMGDFIHPEGWHNWDKPDAEKNHLFCRI